MHWMCTIIYILIQGRLIIDYKTTSLTLQYVDHTYSVSTLQSHKPWRHRSMCAQILGRQEVRTFGTMSRHSRSN